MGLLFFISCTDNINILIQEQTAYLSDDVYPNTVPVDFAINRKHIEDAVFNLQFLQINGYDNKSIEYVKPLENEGEAILWLVQFANNSGWVLFSNHVNTPPIVAHNHEGYFSRNGDIQFEDLLSQPGPAQIFTAVKGERDKAKNRQINNLNYVKTSHAKWSLLVSDVPKLEDKELLSSLQQPGETSARIMAYEHLNMPWVHQMYPFNKFMPDNGNGLCYIGSNNLAIGQVFKFYGQPDDKGWEYDDMTEKWGPDATYIRAEVRQWAKMFLHIANENQPDWICNSNPAEPLWTDGWITHDYEYITNFPEYKDLDFDSTANEEPGGWNIQDVYYHTAVRKQPSIVSAWGYAGDSWYHHTWVIDGCERTGTAGNYTYEVHCLWGWEWDEVSYNGWYNHDYMLGWDLYVSTITDTAPDTTEVVPPSTYELWIDEMGFVDNCQTWIRVDDSDWALYPDETRIQVDAGSTVYYRGESLDVESENIRIVIDGEGGTARCTNMSSCMTSELSFIMNKNERIGIQALRWAQLEDI
jgi:hypothetical protein